MRMNKILFLTISLALLSLLQLGFAQVAPASEAQTVNSVPVATTTTQQPAPVTATPAQTTTTVQQPPVVTQQAPAAEVPQTAQTTQPVQVAAPAAQPAQVAAPAAQPVAQPATQPATVASDVAIEQPQTPPVVKNEAPSVPESTFDTYYRPIDQDEKTTDPNNPNAKATGTIDTMMNYVDAPLMDIVWCGANNKVMFMLTTSLALYRSENDGFTGHVMKEHLHKLGRAELGNEPGEVGEVSKIMQSPVDKNMILLVGTHGINWVTENCGGSFRAMNQGRRVDDFQFHPTEKTWLLASAWTLCDDFVGEPCRNYKELFVSKDLGNNWEMVADYVYQFSWAALDQAETEVPKERIIVAQDPRGTGNQTEGGWIKHHVVAAFDEFGKVFTPLVIGGNKFLLTDNFFFVVQAKDDEAKDVTLLTANPNAKHYIFRQIEIPTKRILDFGYTVLDASEHAVFLHIDHGSTQAAYGTLYVSDSTGVRFTQALKHNARAPTGQCDFERVQGLEGIYLANIYDAEVVKKFQNIEADYWNDFPVQQGGSKKTSEDAFKHPDHYVADLNINSHTNRADSLKKTLEDFKKTMISFDKGSMWQTLVPPATDVTGKKIVCNSEDECALHLHSVTSRNFGPIYSTENSLGLLLGTGNVGEFLSTRPDETNTYLSRDGGLTWFEIAKGPHIYEIGDHGGLIVMAPSTNATRDIYYSWNEGLTWETARISDKYFHVSNIIMEPSNTAEKFMIYGREANGQKGVIAAIDFSSLHQKTCMLPEKPDTPESDYETWTPNGRISPHCLLGRQVTYTRRKRDSKCFNAEEHEEWKIIHQCACTEEDWECDYGYARQGNGPCLAMDDSIKNQSIATPEVCDAYYFMTQGYRKVSGNGCSGGVNHEPIRLPCPGTGVITSKNLSILMLLGSILLAFVWLNNSQNTEKVKGCFHTFKSKLGAIFSKSPAPSKQGYTAHIPNKYADDEDNFTNIIFDENEDTDEPKGDTIDLIEGARNRKMTERNAMEAAKKHVPLLNKPGDKKLDVIRGNF